MVELVKGKRYKLVKLYPGDAYEGSGMEGKIAVFIGNDRFLFENKDASITLLQGYNFAELPPIENEAATMEVKEVRQFESGAVRDNNKGKSFVHSLQGYTRLRFGYHMSKNASKYGADNFLLGIPTSAYLESLDRHLAQYISGDRSEDHLSAILFGVQGVMLNEEKEGVKANAFYGK